MQVVGADVLSSRPAESSSDIKTMDKVRIFYATSAVSSGKDARCRYTSSFCVTYSSVIGAPAPVSAPTVRATFKGSRVTDTS